MIAPRFPALHRPAVNANLRCNLTLSQPGTPTISEHEPREAFVVPFGQHGFSSLERGPNAFEQYLVVEWLAEELNRASPHCLCTHARVAIRCDEDDRNAVVIPGQA